MNYHNTRCHRQKSQWLLTADLKQVLITLTIPMLFGVTALLALDLVDAYLVADLGTDTLAALGFTMPVTNALFGLGIGLSIGIVSLLTKTLGSGQFHLKKQQTSHSLLLTVVVAVAIGLVGYASIDMLFSLMGADQHQITSHHHVTSQQSCTSLMPLIHNYMSLRYLGLLFWLIPIVSLGIIRACGDTRLAGILMACWCLLTMGLDAILVKGLGPVPAFGLMGIAWGHLVADICATFGCLWALARRERLLSLTPLIWLAIKTDWSKIIKIALPATGINLLLPIVAALLTTLVASFGVAAVAAYGVAMRIEPLVLLLPMALTTSLPIFIGQNWAKGNVKRIRTALLRTQWLVFNCQLAGYLLLIAMAPTLSTLFTGDPQVAEILNLFLWLVPLSYGALGICLIATSSLNAIHKPMLGLWLTVLRLLVLSLPMAVAGASIAGLQGLFIGLAVANIVTCIIILVCYNRIIPKSVQSTPLEAIEKCAGAN